MLFFLLLAAALFQGYSAQAMQKWQPGFRTMGLATSDPPGRLDLNIWYPCLRQAQEINIGQWRIRGALNAKIASGKFPLIIFSHASPGNRFLYAGLAARLAENGFLVAAPNHSRDNMDNMDDMFTWRQLERRAEEIIQAMNAVLADKDLGKAVNTERIGVAGFGAGGSAALLLGGALPDCSGMETWRREAGATDPYCSALANEKLDQACRGFPLTKSLAKPQIRAIAAISPGFGMLFGKDSFKYFYPPLLLAGAGKDKFNNPALHSEPMARTLGKAALYLDLPEADAGALMDACPQPLEEELPELCRSVSERDRAGLQARLSAAMLAFFSRHLLEPAKMPFIPAPPDLSPVLKQPEPAPVKPEKPKKRQRRGKAGQGGKS